MYATYKKHAAAPGSILEAFTRIFARGKDDELMMEVPTMRFDPNQAKCDYLVRYPVADRSLAIAQWSRTTDSTRCSHIAVEQETDYIYVRSESEHLAPARARRRSCAYIPYPRGQRHGAGVPNTWRNTPRRRNRRRRSSTSRPRETLRPCLSVRDLRAVAPLWAEFVARTGAPETRKTLGWLRDMYAWDAARASYLGV